MTGRRTLFLVIWTSVFLYYVYDTAYFAMLMLALVSACPISAALAMLPALWKRQITLQAHEADDGDGVTLHLSPSAYANPMMVTLRIENLFTGQTITRRVRLSPGERVRIVCGFPYGMVRFQAVRAAMSDALGLIRWPVRKPAPAVFCIWPKEVVYDNAPLAEPSASAWQTVEAANLRMGERAPSDVRDYRAGDGLRDVHWKLSARHNKIIVREYIFTGEAFTCLVVNTAQDAEKLADSLARALGIANHLLALEASFCIFWMHPEQGLLCANAYALGHREDFADGLSEWLDILLAKQPQAMEAEAEPPAGIDAYTVVEANGMRLFDEE